MFKPTTPIIWLLALGSAFFTTCSLAAGEVEARGAWKLGKQAQSNHHWHAAAGHYETVTREAPGLASAWRHLAVAYYHTKNYAQALKAVDRYLALKPGDGKTRDWADKLRLSQAPGQARQTRHAGSFGLRLGGGWASGLSELAVNTDGSGSTINMAPGQGGVFFGEVLYSFHRLWEAGLGVHPRFFNQSVETSVTAINTVSTRDEARFVTFPIILTLYFMKDLGKSWRLIAGAGLGLATGGTLKIDSEKISTSSTGLIRREETLRSKINSSVAVRSMLGIEYKLTPLASLTIGLEHFLSNLPAEETTLLTEIFNETGALLSPPSEITVTGGDLKFSNLSALAALTFRY